MKNALGSQRNPLASGKGVKILLNKVPHVLTKIKETDVIDTNSILLISREEAATANAAAAGHAETILAKITTRVDAKSKADHQNIARQAAIGAKESTAAGISKHVGTNVTTSGYTRRMTTQRTSTSGTSTRLSPRWLWPLTSHPQRVSLMRSLRSYNGSSIFESALAPT